MSDTYTFEQLKKMSKHLLDERKILNEEQLANGMKMFNIAYLSLAPDTTDLDRHQAGMLYRIMHREIPVLANLA